MVFVGRCPFHLRNFEYFMVIPVPIKFTSAKSVLNYLLLSKIVPDPRPSLLPPILREGENLAEMVTLPVQGLSVRVTIAAAACDTQYCFPPSRPTRVPYSGYTVPRRGSLRLPQFPESNSRLAAVCSHRLPDWRRSYLFGILRTNL